MHCRRYEARPEQRLRQGVGSVLATNDESRHLVVSIQLPIDGQSILIIFSSKSMGFDANPRPVTDADAIIPHIKAMNVPFHLIYGSLICAKRLESDRQNKEGCFQTPGGHQDMIIKYLPVGPWS